MTNYESKDLKIEPYTSVQNLNVPEQFAKIILPFRMLIAGPSMSGKSTFIFNLIKHEKNVFGSSFSEIHYYGDENDRHILHLRDINDKIHFHLNEEPKFDNISKTVPFQSCIIIEDLMLKMLNHSDFTTFLTKTSHHCNISVIVTSQNFFQNSKYAKTIQRNMTHKVIFYDRSDALLYSTLGRQIFPLTPHFLLEIFEWINTNIPSDDLQYILIDSSSLSYLPKSLMLLTSIFPAAGTLKSEPIFFINNT